jgi:hypothetical protein
MTPKNTICLSRLPACLRLNELAVHAWAIDTMMGNITLIDKIRKIREGSVRFWL